MNCKNCGSESIIKWGKVNGVPRYFCKSCKRKFADNGALPGMSTPIEHVADAVHSHFEGMSLDAITRNIEQEGNTVSDAAIFKWVDRFTDEAIHMTKDLHPEVGQIWVGDETVLKIGGKNVWMFDIMDADTRFLLATRIALTRTMHDTQAVMEDAKRRAGKSPKAVVTDKMKAYPDAIDMAFGGEAEHRQGGPFKKDDSNTNLIERLHGSLKGRTKVMRGLKDINSAMQFVDGWTIHYNYFRPHIGLKGKTPAEVSGLKLPCRNWGELISQSRGRVAKARHEDVPLYQSPKVATPMRVLGEFATKGRVRITKRRPRITPPMPSLGTMR